MYVDAIRSKIVVFDNDALEIGASLDLTTWKVGVRWLYSEWGAGPDYELYGEIQFLPVRLYFKYDHDR